MRSASTLIVIITLTSLVTSCSTPDADVTIQQAEAFTEELIAASQPMLDSEGGSTKFCETFASDMTMCETSLAEADDAGSTPSLAGTPDIEYERIWSGSVVVTVSINAPDGTHFASQLELLVENGDVRAVDPVFWVERTIVGGGGR